MKVLLVTYNCSPGAGSEDGVGWNMVKNMSRHHEVVAITRGVYKDRLEAENLPDRGHRIRFVYVNNPVSRESVIYKYGYQVLYYIWHVITAFKVRGMTTGEKFDIIQHITWCRCWMPSAIMGATSGHIVWGPVGGVETIPVSFLRKWRYGKVAQWSKKIAMYFARFDPILHFLGRKASIGLSMTRASEQFMKSVGCKSTRVLGESALSDEDLDFLSSIKGPLYSGIRFLSMGRLLSWKGFQYGIEAFAKAAIPESEYWVVGDGPMGEDLRELAKELGVEDKVHFLGWKKRNEVLQILSECHVLVHPSLRDSGGWVCLEAMAARRPVICLDYGGPATQVTSNTGFVITPDSPEMAVSNMAHAMLAYAEDQSLLREHGEAALRRIQANFTWNSRMKILDEIYKGLI